MSPSVEVAALSFLLFSLTDPRGVPSAPPVLRPVPRRIRRAQTAALRLALSL